jgi:hypothetical protein
VHFLEWYIGFGEGDGCFVLRKTPWLTFTVTQGAPNREVLYYIQKTLGMGTVQEPDMEDVCHYDINRTEHIRAIILLFYGN